MKTEVSRFFRNEQDVLALFYKTPLFFFIIENTVVLPVILMGAGPRAVGSMGRTVFLLQTCKPKAPCSSWLQNAVMTGVWTPWSRSRFMMGSLPRSNAHFLRPSWSTTIAQPILLAWPWSGTGLLRTGIWRSPLIIVSQTITSVRIKTPFGSGLLFSMTLGITPACSGRSCGAASVRLQCNQRTFMEVGKWCC